MMRQAFARTVGLAAGGRQQARSRGHQSGQRASNASTALPRSTFGWIGMALLVIVMQTAGLAHRIQHGDAAVPGLTAAMSLGKAGAHADGLVREASATGDLSATFVGAATASSDPSETAGPSVTASATFSPAALAHAHFGHSCVLFDGDALFVGGAVFVTSLAPFRVSLAAPRSVAGVSPDLAPLRTFLSRAPPRDIRSALA